jgi:hypothetical protein
MTKEEKKPDVVHPKNGSFGLPAGSPSLIAGAAAGLAASNLINFGLPYLINPLTSVLSTFVGYAAQTAVTVVALPVEGVVRGGCNLYTYLRGETAPSSSPSSGVAKKIYQ